MAFAIVFTVSTITMAGALFYAGEMRMTLAGPSSVALKRMNGFSPVRIRRLGSKVGIGTYSSSGLSNYQNQFAAEMPSLADAVGGGGFG